MNSECFAAFRWTVSRFFHVVPSASIRRETESVPLFVSSVLPAAGALAGLLIWAAVSIVGRLAGSTVSLLFAGLVVPLVMETLTGWTGFRALASFLELRRRGVPSADVLRMDWSEISASGEPAEQVIPISVYLFRCGLYAILASQGGGMWFLLAWTGSFLVRAELTVLPDAGSGRPFFPVPGRYGEIRFDVLLSAAIFLAGGIFSWNLFPALAGFAAAVLLSVWALKLQRRAGGVLDESRLAFYGAGAEFILLLVGVLLS